MSCALTNTYNVPCRQLSGVNTVYLAGSDNTFKVSATKTLTGFIKIHQNVPSDNSDVYTAGTYSVDMVYRSSDDDLYYPVYPLNTSKQVYLPYYITTFNIQVVVGAVVNPSVPQPITITITSINNNYAIPNFYFRMSDVVPVSVSHNNSVIVGPTFTVSDTYQIDYFTKNFYHFTQRLEQASFLESGVYSSESMSYNQKLEITLEGYDGTTMKIIDTLNRARLRAIVIDQYNNYYLVGNVNYLTTSSGEGGLGKAATDGVKTTLTFEGKELLPALQLDNSVILNGMLIG